MTPLMEFNESLIVISIVFKYNDFNRTEDKLSLVLTWNARQPCYFEPTLL